MVKSTQCNSSHVDTTDLAVELPHFPRRRRVLHRVRCLICQWRDWCTQVCAVGYTMHRKDLSCKPYKTMKHLHATCLYIDNTPVWPIEGSCLQWVSPRSPLAFVLHDGNGAMDNHVVGALTNSLQRKAGTEYTMDIESIWDA